jgi:hypothetical protein
MPAIIYTPFLTMLKMKEKLRSGTNRLCLLFRVAVG